MALDTFDNLVKEIIDWSHRDDLGTKIPDFIQLAENAMYSNSVNPLKIRQLETITTQLTTADKITLHTNFESARSVRLILPEGGGELKFQAPEQMNREPTTGRPRFFTIIGNQLEFNRTPDSSYTIEFQFYARATNLSVTNQTNDILTNHPSVYLFGALSALFKFAQDTEQELSYSGQFIDSIKGANKADKRGRYGPAPAASLESGIV